MAQGRLFSGAGAVAFGLLELAAYRHTGNVSMLLYGLLMFALVSVEAATFYRRHDERPWAPQTHLVPHHHDAGGDE